MIAIRSFLRLTFVLAAVLVPSACKSEIDGKPKAKVGQAGIAEPTTSPAAIAPAGEKRLGLDPKASKLEFVGAKVSRDHTGVFSGLTGSATLVDREPRTVEVTAELATVTTDSEKLANHLKSADFFDVERYPKAVFRSTEIGTGGEGGATHTIVGDLELHGVRKQIRFPATLVVDGQSASGRAEFTLDRKDFGIVYPGAPDDLIRDDVLVRLDLRFSAV